ncbi:MAG: hypothetical protein K0S76_2421 [Herbinix sp.]|jgi:signal peptidase I|nr:hypothetical protein [Herbinix sp.]
MQKRVLREIFSWTMVFVIAFGLAIFINKVIVYKVKIPSGSMENTIMVGDKVITFRLAYLFSEPKRGDIVVFPFPDNEKEDYIKRIIGLPGETVEIKKDEDNLVQVYIDGEPLDEPYLKEAMILNGNTGPYVVPEGSYFMMGDNRNVSADSRVWDNKFLHRDKIDGKAILKYPDFEWIY